MLKYNTLFLLSVLLTSCSGIKLTDSWKSDNFKVEDSETILVAANSPNIDVQKFYEFAMVQRLRAKGFKAVALHQKFPDMMYRKEERSDAEKLEIVTRFKEANISKLLITSLKDQFTTAKVIEPTSIVSADNFKNKYSFVLGAEDITKLPDLQKLDNTELDSEIKVIRSTTYVLEAFTYDLSLPRETQLIYASLVTIVDPKSSNQVLKSFTGLATKPF